MGKKVSMILWAILIAMSIVLPSQALAQQKVIELTYGTAFAADHTFSKADALWIAKIEKETQSRVKIKPYWGGQVIGGANAVEELAGGVADIAYVSPNNTKTGFAIAKAIQLFFAGASEPMAMRVYQQLRVKFPEIDKEYTDAGIKPLEYSVNTQEILSAKPIRKLDDLKGKRIRVVGDWAKVLRAVGSEGITTSTSEMYTGMQKGILDGILGLTEGLESLKLADVVKYVSMYDMLAAPFSGRAMNLAKWNSLPPDIQKVFMSNVEYWSKVTEDGLAAACNQAVEYAKKRGLEVINPSDKAQLAAIMVSLADKDAKELDTKGIRGTAILQEAQRLIKGGK
ncbi:MAG TPA: TRAP transporter substrate-binding protein DctP [Syntrophorhabdaceae bacterium]|nr:TRAP transporter substrate-binding protein DctP [Syntrophorhabdaceae bacterium]